MPLHNTYGAAASLSTTATPKLGGTCSIQYIPWEDVAQWPDADPVTGIITSPLVLKAGKSFFDLKATEPDRTFSEQQKAGAEGRYFEQQLSARLAGSSAPAVQALDAMKLQQWAVVIKERTGDKRLLGSADCGAAFTWNYTSGDWDTSRMTELKWNWQSPNAAPFYNP